VGLSLIFLSTKSISETSEIGQLAPPYASLREESYDGPVPDIHLVFDHPALLLDANQLPLKG